MTGSVSTPHINPGLRRLPGEGDVGKRMPRYSRDEVADHCHGDSCWIVINNRVYDVTAFVKVHPGGEDIILECGGQDASTIFMDTGHSLDAYEMMGLCLIGEVTEDNWIPETMSR